MRTRFLLIALGLCVVVGAPAAQTDLDDLMSRVLTNRDANWKKLQQYILDETQTMQVTGPNDLRIFGGRRESMWFPRDGFFIRSPLRVDGVDVGEDERARAEARYLRREQAREKRRQEREKERSQPGLEVTDAVDSPDDLGDILRQTAEPDFVSQAYFLRFKFEQGRYALVGREKYRDRTVLRVEYYPDKAMFSDDDDDAANLTPEQRKRREERRREREERIKKNPNDIDARIERQMNKVARATLWVEPTERQIVQYQLHNMDMDFLPGRSMVRADELNASMRMGEPFQGVWLPESLEIRAGFTTALGHLAARYDVRYTNYRLATTGARLVK